MIFGNCTGDAAKRCWRWIALLVAVGCVRWGALAVQSAIHRRLERSTAADRKALLRSLRDVPPAPLRELQVLTPYATSAKYGVIEIGGPERATCSFVENETGLKVSVSIHTCRPRVMQYPQRFGEINLINGSDTDLCTSGGGIRITDPQTDEEFRISFMLIGTPDGIILWNAREFVTPRTDGGSWEQTLASLREHLQPASRGPLPATSRAISNQLETYDAATSERLMFGNRREMERLLTFRTAFERFYDAPKKANAGPIAWLLIDTLLKSPEQRRRSEQWLKELHPGQ